MTILATLAGNVTVQADPSAAHLFGNVEVTDDVEQRIALTVSNVPAVAAAQRFQQPGVRVDLGGVTLPDREKVRQLTIDETTDAYGDRLTVRLAGQRFSPGVRALLQTRAPLDIYLRTGNTANEHTEKVFSGHVVTAPFDVHPPSANITALDAAALYTERRAKSYVLAANSRKTRAEIATELLNIGGIPIRFLDVGGNGGGIVTKPVAPGDRPVVDFLRDFLGILGCEVGFIEGGFVAVRYDPYQSPVLEISPRNVILPGTLTAPETTRANVLGVVSTEIAITDTSHLGQKTVETSVIVRGIYAPAIYANRQTNVGGEAVLTPNGASPVSGPRVISEVVTRTSYLGSMDIRTEQTEKGWYAERATSKRIETSEDPPGYVIIPETGYIYGDGSTRVRPAEIFQTTRTSLKTKTLDTAGNVVAIREERSLFRFFRKALWTVANDPELPGSQLREDLIATTSLDDEGGGVEFTVEHIGRYGPDEISETRLTLNPDGTIQQEETIDSSYDIGQERARIAGAYGYGVDPRTYAARSTESPDGAFPPVQKVTTKRYRQVSEDRYETVQIVKVGSQPPVVTTTQAIGAPPRPERLEPQQVSQEVRAEVADSRRIALVGEEIEDIEHNEFVETDAEARAYARVRAMRAAAVTITCDIPLETQVHKWKMVTVNLPGSGINGLRFYVRAVRRDIANYRETITADYYPPELI